MIRGSVVLALLGAVRSQPCTLEALPASTEWLPDQTGCSLGADGIDDNAECTIQCQAGNAQGEDGTYVYTCTEGTLDEAAPTCSECEADQWNDTPGAAGCLPCPANSGTSGATGSESVAACECDAGHEGTITDPDDECSVCAFNFYKEAVGTEDCLPCPGRSVTQIQGAVSITQCECDAGDTGTIEGPDDDCEPCPENSWKEDVGDAQCIGCPENSGTEGQEGSTRPQDCVCAEGYAGTIGGEFDRCRIMTSLSPDAVIGISAAAVAGVGAAFGGIMYSKGAYARGRRYSTQSNDLDPRRPLIEGERSSY